MKTLQVKVKPNARERSFEPSEDGLWLARLKSPPVDGRANDELIALVAQYFGLARSQVSIRSGTAGRMKLLQLDE